MYYPFLPDFHAALFKHLDGNVGTFRRLSYSMLYRLSSYLWWTLLQARSGAAS
jgi:hypothetical protein